MAAIDPSANVNDTPQDLLFPVHQTTVTNREIICLPIAVFRPAGQMYVVRGEEKGSVMAPLKP